MKIKNFKRNIIIILLSALVIFLGLVKHKGKQDIVNIQNRKIELTKEAQNELWEFYNTAQGLANKKNRPEEKTTATFLAVGDIMLSRNVAQKIKEANNPLLPFKNFKEIANGVDFSFGNLESPIDPSLFPSPKDREGREKFVINDVPSGTMIFKAAPITFKGLIENNFKILSLANNHALDQGIAGLEYTIKYLDENNIKHTGASTCHPEQSDGQVEESFKQNLSDSSTSVGMTKKNCLNEAWAPAFVEQNGIKICFIGASYASINDGGKTTNNYVARIEDLKNLKTSIQNIKSTCDFIIASMHAGTEYTTKPNKAQIDFAHSAIDFGADMVIGHHPHWVQEIEKYCPSSSPLPLGEGMGEGCKYIFYSLGNFIFDQMWSQETREGLTLKIQISKIKNQSKLQGPKNPSVLENIELIPIIIDNYSTPRKASEEEEKKILEKIEVINKILQ